jgi:SAM-dependent methyltransferase
MKIIYRSLLCSSLAASTLSQGVEEVPFVVTPDNVTLAMLELARVGPNDYVIDLGSGDGRIVIVAAQRFGARGLGVEIVPELVKKSRESANNAGVAKRAEFLEQDLFKTDLSPATVVTLYLLPDVNLQLRPSILALRPGTRVVSHDWDMGDWKPDHTISVAAPDKKIGLEKSSKVHYWVVPAKVAGTWCGTRSAAGTRLELAQKFQEFRGTVAHGESAKPIEGRIEGSALRGTDSDKITLKVEGDGLSVISAHGGWASLANGSFTRASTRTACTSPS